MAAVFLHSTIITQGLFFKNLHLTSLKTLKELLKMHFCIVNEKREREPFIDIQSCRKTHLKT